MRAAQPWKSMVVSCVCNRTPSVDVEEHKSFVIVARVEGRREV